MEKKPGARQLAVQALIRLENGAYSNMVLEPMLARAGLAPRDAAFARALFYTTLERRVSADFVLAPVCSRPLESMDAQVRWILRTGVSQLLWMDGVNDYAAVSESVELTRTMDAPKASGLVNGVLRGIIRAGKCIPWKGSEDETLRMAVSMSCPEWLVGLWIKSYGEKNTRAFLEASLLTPPLYIRVNTLKTSVDELAALLEAAGAVCEKHTPDGCLRVSGTFAPGRDAAFKQGLYHVQDRASQHCAALLDARPGHRVLDVCSAPGGKSFTIAQHMKNEGRLVARELHEKRTALVKEGAARMGLGCIETAAGDAAKYDESLGTFDRVLCDVPCSGFGVIRRRPEIKYKTWESIQKLPDLQYKILQTSAHYLSQGGLLLYSTCTLNPAENEQVVERFLAAESGFEPVELHTRMNLPQDGDSDGFFTALLRRK